VPIVTYEDVKAHLNLTDDSDAYELARFIDAATNIVEQRVGTVMPTAYSETYNAYGWMSLPLRHTPVQSIQTVTEYAFASGTQVLTAQPAGTTYDSYGYRLESKTSGGLTRRAFGWPVPFRGPVTVTYTAGLDVVPPAVQLATLVIVAHLWQTQRGTAALPSLGGDPVAAAPVAAGAVPPLAQELLRGYDTRTPAIA
jgi:uncharacterized phiE125 gp8 family phage protein